MNNFGAFGAVRMGWSETSPAPGLRVASGSKNTISQVLSHELKIARHSFPVRPPPHPHPNGPAALCVPWQKATFLPTWWRNLMKRRKVWGEHTTHISHNWPRPPPSTLQLSSEDVFTVFYYLFSFFFYLIVNFRDVWIRWQMGRKCKRDTSVGRR